MGIEWRQQRYCSYCWPWPLPAIPSPDISPPAVSACKPHTNASYWQQKPESNMTNPATHPLLMHLVQGGNECELATMQPSLTWQTLSYSLTQLTSLLFPWTYYNSGGSAFELAIDENQAIAVSVVRRYDWESVLIGGNLLTDRRVWWLYTHTFMIYESKFVVF